MSQPKRGYLVHCINCGAEYVINKGSVFRKLTCGTECLKAMRGRVWNVPDERFKILDGETDIEVAPMRQERCNGSWADVPKTQHWWEGGCRRT